MNKKIVKAWIKENPPTVSASYLFIVDNQDIALNILSVDMRCILLEHGNEFLFSVEELIDFLRDQIGAPVCLTQYHFVLACLSWIRHKGDRI